MLLTFYLGPLYKKAGKNHKEGMRSPQNKITVYLSITHINTTMSTKVYCLQVLSNEIMPGASYAG